MFVFWLPETNGNGPASRYLLGGQTMGRDWIRHSGLQSEAEEQIRYRSLAVMGGRRFRKSARRGVAQSRRLNVCRRELFISLTSMLELDCWRRRFSSSLSSLPLRRWRDKDGRIKRAGIDREGNVTDANSLHQ